MLRLLQSRYVNLLYQRESGQFYYLSVLPLTLKIWRSVHWWHSLAMDTVFVWSYLARTAVSVTKGGQDRTVPMVKYSDIVLLTVNN